MADESPQLTRRNALRGAGGLLGVGAFGGLAGGTETLRAAVGYAADEGRRAALGAASEVVYDYAFPAVVVEGPAGDVAALADRDDVRYVERAIEFEVIAQTLPWGVDRVDAEVAHASDGEDGLNGTGDGVHVAVIDTGIDLTHPDLAGNLGPGRTFLSGTELPEQQDDMGHGTFCAGVVDAIDDSSGVVGVGTEATLHGIKAFTAAGVGLSFDIARAIDYVAEEGYDVANMSFGAAERSDLIADACDHAYYERGVLLVAAAGNSGPCGDCVAYPAANEPVVAVSATDRNDAIAGFSSTGPEVELAAPGVDIFSTYVGGTYTRMSGTSFACPHVSGTGALLMANGYTNAEARDRMNATAEEVGLSRNEQGNGLVDAAAALGLDSSDDLDSETEIQEESQDEGSDGNDTASDDSGDGGDAGDGGSGNRNDDRSGGGEASDDGRDSDGQDTSTGAGASVESDGTAVGASADVDL